MLKRDAGRAGTSALELLHAAVTTMAAASSLPDAASSFLREVCPRIVARRGVIWAVEPDEVTARCVGSWQHATAHVGAPGVLVQQSWESREPAGEATESPGDTVPLRSLVSDEGAPTRLLAAHATGMSGSGTFPLRFAGPLVGVLEVWRAGSPIDLERRRAIETAAVCLAYWLRHDLSAMARP